MAGKVKTKKMNLRVESFYGKKVNLELDIVKKVDNKILAKTFIGFTELTFSEHENCWIVSNEGKEIPKEWESFIIWED